MSKRRELHVIPRVKASKILSALYIEEPDEIDISKISRYCRCDIRDGGLDGADGRSIVRHGRAIIRVRADITEEGRRRYTIAHEIGHVRLEHPGASCSKLDMRRHDGTDAEPEANAFAAELLMPRRMFAKCVRGRAPSLALAEDLAPIFRTTFTATAVRMVDLSDEPCAVVWSHNGSIKWVIATPDFPGFVQQGRLSSYTFASNPFRGLPLPTEPQRVPSDSWLTGGHGTEELLEETRWFRRFGATFTLLREV